jgi:hypothetical protein
VCCFPDVLRLVIPIGRFRHRHFIPICQMHLDPFLLLLLLIQLSFFLDSQIDYSSTLLHVPQSDAHIFELKVCASLRVDLWLLICDIVFRLLVVISLDDIV